MAIYTPRPRFSYLSVCCRILPTKASIKTLLLDLLHGVFVTTVKRIYDLNWSSHCLRSCNIGLPQTCVRFPLHVQFASKSNSQLIIGDQNGDGVQAGRLPDLKALACPYQLEVLDPGDRFDSEPRFKARLVEGALQISRFCTANVHLRPIARRPVN